LSKWLRFAPFRYLAWTFHPLKSGSRSPRKLGGDHLEVRYPTTHKFGAIAHKHGISTAYKLDDFSPTKELDRKSCVKCHTSETMFELTLLIFWGWAPKSRVWADTTHKVSWFVTQLCRQLPRGVDSSCREYLSSFI